MIVWSSALETGFKEIDRQHKELFDKLQWILTHTRERKSRDSMAPFLMYLRWYVSEHFQLEERTMLENNFEGLKDHRAEHVKFAGELATMEQEYLQGHNSVTVIKINTTVTRWLKEHILRRDVELANFLKEKGKLNVGQDDGGAKASQV